ncbi:hypothetical protein GOV08_02140 [Candidatus Woesearchaeota archaeon]|nr:hypothetical protein [Candidatus Woesearchaeota archaeon]
MDMDEIKQKLSAWVNKAIDWIRDFPEMFKNSPWDEQSAWGSIGLGLLLVVAALIVW